MRRAVCLLTGDWHVSGKPPIARSEEKDWWATQRGYLRQVERIAAGGAGLLTDRDPLSIIVPGDLFHKSSPHPEVINFLMESMPPNVYAIPGNHDLPNHRYEDRKKSGFWTLHLAGKLNLIESETLLERKSIRLHGFPCGIEPTPLADPHDLYIEMAVVHTYLWVKGCGYQGAPEEARVGKMAERFRGYDVVVSGDNHTPFTVKKNGTLFVNTGSLMRLTADQEDYKPAVWVLYDDLTVEPRYLDVRNDKFQTDHLDKSGNHEDMSELIDALRDVRDEEVNFDEAVMRVIRKGELKKRVVQTLLYLMGDKQ